jgi:hypothetical protein
MSNGRMNEVECRDKQGLETDETETEKLCHKKEMSRKSEGLGKRRKG